MTRLPLLLVWAFAFGITVCGQKVRRSPEIGYVYPAGIRQGTETEVLVGGQFLRGITDIVVSGEGVTAEVIHFYKPFRNLSREQRDLLKRTLRDLREKRLAETDHSDADAGPGKNRNPAGQEGAPERPMQMSQAATPPEKDHTEVALPEHPLLRNLEKKSLRELRHIADQLLNFKTFLKRQRNAQLAEQVLVRIRAAPGAEPGNRELRFLTRFGLTNPVCFQVGWLPEVQETEPNDPGGFPMLPAEPPLDVPIVANGQILPGDVDRLRFRARKGQRLVFHTHARSLVPYLADAVPGWFQATLTLFDATGTECAFADDYRCDPDPVLFYDVPRDGVYELEIRDAVYRGREDFVYRIEIGELPFIMWHFPLGAREGTHVVTELAGWHLQRRELVLDTRPGGAMVRRTTPRDAGQASNTIAFAVGDLPECSEKEPNDSVTNGQRLKLPLVVNGRISRPGDRDTYVVRAAKGDTLVVEVTARCLGSPLDSVVRLVDAEGQVIAWNDDLCVKDAGHLHTGPGLLTHHADSYVSAEIPADGMYGVVVEDVQHHGSPAYAYRLRLSAPRPDFALKITPSGLRIPAGSLGLATVYAQRKDGFRGDIEIAVKDPSTGFTVSGGCIPAGCDRVQLTLRAPADPIAKVFPLELEGRAAAGGQTLRRPVCAADDRMQAFLYRHLVPSRQFLVAVPKPKWFLPRLEIACPDPLEVRTGTRAKVVLKSDRRRLLNAVELEIADPLPGVTIENIIPSPGGLAFDVAVTADATATDFAGNLIVEAFRRVPARGGAKGAKDAKPVKKAAGETRRVPIGVLPAIPLRIVCR